MNENWQEEKQMRPSACLLASMAAGALLFSTAVRASVLYSIDGSTYSQDFDSLPNTPQNASLGNTPTGWTDDNAAPAAGNFSIVGWYLYHPNVQTEGGFSGNQRMRIGAGTANTGAFMSFGASGSTDRALSGLASNTMAPAGSAMFTGLRLTNNTGTVLNQFTLSYDGEQWRDGGASTPNAQSLLFDWSTTATGIDVSQSASYTAAPALNFTSPVFTNTGTGAAVDGNVAGKLSIGPVTVAGINWQPGTDLWLRWSDLNDAGNDHGLGIDNLSFSASAIPEPATLGLLALGSVVLAARRRQK
jgi:hypothetical protein